MCDSMKTPEEKAAEAFFGSKADAVHGLFFPPAPASNMALFCERISQAIERQRERQKEADKATIAERFRLIRDNPRLQDKEAGPPETKAKVNWTWEAVTHPDTGDVLEGWLHDGLGLVWPVGILKDDPDADGCEERIARAYLDIALVHDRTDEHFQRGRLKLLDDFALPDEIDGENARFAAFMVGDYFPGQQEPGDERRRKIEQALADVKGDLDSHAADAAEHQGDKPEPDGKTRVSCAQIAEILGLSKNSYGAIQQRLARFREQHTEGWVKTNEPARNKSQYLYEWGKVKSFVQGVLSVPLTSHSQE